MKNRSFFFIILLLSLFFGSCNRDSGKVAGILRAAEDVMEQNPDSALVLLDSIPEPYELNKKQHAEYILCLVRAKYKSDKDISNDTLIFKARDYFKKSNDMKYWALAAFYSGRVLQSLQKSQEALKAFLEAESVAVLTQDTSDIGFIRFNIGAAHFQNGLYDDAIIKFKQASENFSRQEKDQVKEIMSLSYIGSCFVVINKIDSALFYFDEALAKATNLNDSTNRAGILQNIGAVLLEAKENEKAKEKLIEARKFSNDPLQQAQINLNSAKAYAKLNRLDSATFYISLANESAQKTNDKIFQASVFYYLSQIDEKKEDYKAALEDYKKYSNLLSVIYNERQQLNFSEIEKKYNFELIQRTNRQLVIEKQRIIIISLAVILVLSFIAFIQFRKKKQDEKVILLATQEIYQLKNIINNSDLIRNHSTENGEDAISKINDKLKETLAKQFGILKRIALLENILSNEEKEKGKAVLKRVYGIVYGQDEYDWNVLINAINDLLEEYADQLHSVAPHLKESEFRICCLSKAGLSNSEIAGLLKTTTNAIQLRKTHIRKAMKMQEKSNFVCELDKLIYKS